MPMRCITAPLRCTPQVCVCLWACILFTSFPCAQDTGGEDTYIDTKDVLKASDCGRLGRQAADHPWSALRVVKAAEKTAQRPRCCSSQSSSSASRTAPELTISTIYKGGRE